VYGLAWADDALWGFSYASGGLGMRIDVETGAATEVFELPGAWTGAASPPPEGVEFDL
jgi:hypothetical protein